LFESFRSTVIPNTTGGTWTDQNENPRNNANDVFNPTGYQSDPIARLDLVFNNNTGDELDATRVGASYSNDEPIFKSRTQSQDNATDGGPADDNGPFGSGTRLRNAQRLADRDVNIGGTQLPPLLTIGASDSFLYPGMGQSTFRVDLSGGGNVFGSVTTPFLLDGNPYVDFTDANGVPLTAPNGGPLGIDLMPWGWSVLP
jgi:trimeric autotransporter adhesin